MANTKKDTSRPATNHGSANQSDAGKGDNRSNTDPDGNRGGGQGAKRQPGNLPADTHRNPSVGQDDEDKRNRERGDGTKRDGTEKRRTDSD